VGGAKLVTSGGVRLGDDVVDNGEFVVFCFGCVTGLNINPRKLSNLRNQGLSKRLEREKGSLRRLGFKGKECVGARAKQGVLGESGGL
jgi:hypothetical protein